MKKIVIPVPDNFIVKTLTYYDKTGTIIIHGNSGNMLRPCDLNFKFRIFRMLNKDHKLWTTIQALSLIPNDVILEAFYEKSN